MRHAWLPATLLALTLVACSQSGSRTLVDGDTRTPLSPKVDPVKAAGGRALHVELEDGVRLLGVLAPDDAQGGQKVKVTLWWEITKPVGGAPLVFVHGQIPLAEVNQTTVDHPLAGLPATQWKRGDVYVDRFEVTVPKGLGADALELWTGLYEAKHRFKASITTPDKPKKGDVNDDVTVVQDDRVRVAVLRITDGPQTLPRAQVHKRTAPITIDGVLDDADWATATRLGPFIAWDARSPVRFPTYARMVWDEDNLYVAFEATDPDVFTTYKNQDDPLYESEAVEVFIDADGDQDVYVELESAADDVHFDSAFSGGRRQHPDLSFDAGFTTKTTVQGTLNDPSDVDTGFISEWKIPVKDLKDIPAGQPKVGASWRINLFRLERIRTGNRVTSSEATAWSTPASGDFHNLPRMGTIDFVE